MLNMKMTTEEQITTLDVDLHDFKGRSRSRMDRKIIDAEQGWEYMLQGITKLKKILEGSLEPNFSSKEYIMLYTTIYNMCTQKPPNDHSQQLYDKFKDAFHEYIKSTVLPSIKEKHDEFMLRELVQRWANHKVMDYGSIFLHLVVAPLSTLGNWEREFATWVPQMNVVMYVGFAQARTVIKKSSKKSCWKQAGHDQI